jgi:hypothetical protein
MTPGIVPPVIHPETPDLQGIPGESGDGGNRTRVGRPSKGAVMRLWRRIALRAIRFYAEKVERYPRDPNHPWGGVLPWTESDLTTEAQARRKSYPAAVAPPFDEQTVASAPASAPHRGRS